MSTAAQHARLFEVFDALCDLPASEQRARLAELAREDRGLAVEVTDLLELDEGEGAPADPSTLTQVVQRSAAAAALGNPLIEAMRTASEEAPLRLGGYEITGPLGEGGAGAVFRARDLGSGRAAAIKTMSRVAPAQLERFRSEFRAVADVHHPHLATLYELWRDEPTDVLLFSMELVEGARDLMSWVEAGDRFERLGRALPPLVDALGALHAAGQLHLDIKPGNVLVDASDRLVVLDFGLTSSDLAAADPERAVSGTPAYMAPEQVEGGRLGPAADWYALGVVVYRALTGRLPFEGAPLDVMYAKLEAPFRDPEALAPDAPGALLELCRELLARDPEARPDEAGIRRRLGMKAPAKRASGSFVGRRRELERLHRLAAEVGAAEALVVELSGPSGIGKSALARRFVETLEGSRAFVGRCYEREALPFKGLDDVMSGVALASPGTAEDAAALGPIFSGWEGEAEARDPQEARRLAVAAMRRVVGAAGPSVLVIEDAQWGDSDSAHLLRGLLRAPAPAVMLLLVHRAGETGHGELLAELLDRRELPEGVRHEKVELGPLAEKDALELARALGTGAQAEAIAKAAEGVPFFVEELVAAEGAGDVDALLKARLEALPADLARVVDLLAVAGEPVAEAQMWEAAEVSSDPFAAADRLKAARIALRTGDERFELYHDRVRAAVDARLDEAARQGLHGRLAVTLEAAGAAAATVARHYHGAGESERAGGLALEAARQAREALAFERAAAHYADALAWLGSPDVVALQGARGDVLSHADRGAEASEAYLAAAEASEGAARRRYRRRAAEQLFYSGREEAALEIAEPLLASYGLKLPRTPGAVIRRMLLNLAALRLRGMKFEERPAAEIDPLELERLDALLATARGLGMGEGTAPAALFTDYMRLALRVGEPARVAQGLAHYGTTLALLSRRGFERAQPLFELSRELAERSGDDDARDYAPLGPAFALYMRCGYREACAILEQSWARLETREVAAQFQRLVIQMTLPSCLLYLGRYEETLERCAAWRWQRQDRGDAYGARVAALCGETAALPLGRAQGVDALAMSAATAPKTDTFHLSNLYELTARHHGWVMAGKVAEAAAHFESQWTALRKSGLLYLPAVRMSVLGMRGRLAAASGSWSAAKKAARRLRKDRIPACTGEAALVETSVALGRGAKDVALARLEEAVGTFEEASMVGHAASARVRLAELSGDDALGEASLAVLAGLGVVEPARWARCLTLLSTD